ncbi:hypothetical protein SAMN04487886_102519 [Clostridium sp. DSM 8431]|uniref:DUF6608 family protein n=1 Tax=Clostridium sp. DSM 8431 TaxID=1761781 RepID=UPI0008E2F3B1|nr:DUF6608 family protein [Clostridium sp. DSM 8431]SFU42812.1 hypothetical protein SAMN04487886_102519 [Clostridium sp. DSM 8431]
MKKIYNLFLLFCGIFTAVTLVSSVWQLLDGQESDTNAHILIRGIFTLVGVGFYALFKYINIKNKYIKILTQYIVSVAFIFIVVWGIGFFGELSKNAYRDAFFNWSGVFASVVIIDFIVKKVRKKHNIEIES